MRYFIFLCMLTQCILYLEHRSVWTSHISSAQWPHVASGFNTGQNRSELLKSQGKIIRVGVKGRLEPQTGHLAWGQSLEFCP